MIDFAAARKKMLENQLRTSAITDRRLLAVMAQVPREQFVPEARRELAYIDEVHPLPTSSGAARFLAAPAPFARMVQLAGVNTDDAVLDVGCGTGYSTAVLADLADRVVAVENDAGLAEAARANLAELGIDNAKVIENPLEAGAPAEALLKQLADGGRLVALVRQGAAAAAYLYVRSGDDVAGRPEFNTTLPPLAPAKTPSEFVF